MNLASSAEESFVQEMAHLHAKDFSNSNNEEFLLLKLLIDNQYETTTTTGLEQNNYFTSYEAPHLAQGVHPLCFSFESQVHHNVDPAANVQQMSQRSSLPHHDPLAVILPPSSTILGDFMSMASTSIASPPFVMETPTINYRSLPANGVDEVACGSAPDEFPLPSGGSMRKRSHLERSPPKAIPSSSPPAKQRVMKRKKSSALLAGGTNVGQEAMARRSSKKQSTRSVRSRAFHQEEPADEEESPEEQSRSRRSSAEEDNTVATRRPNYQSLTMRGENRLKINFHDFGDIGLVPQKFGKHGCWIPHGLRGSNQVYEQPWVFEVSHVPVENSVVCISWKITNKASGTVVEVIESPQEALQRENSGRTICNVVLKQAFEVRAKELERTLPVLASSPTKLTSVQNMIRALRPKRCTVGLLFFGLLHESVQQRMEDIITERGL